MNRLGSTHFTRVSGTLELEGIRARTLPALLDGVAGGSAPDRLIVSDLSLGAWRGCQVASEFASQLHLTLPSPPMAESPAAAANSRFSYADLIGRFIDAEGRGDVTTLRALELAETIAASLEHSDQRTFVVIAPRYHLPWEPENVLFIRFFAQALRNTGNRLLLVCADQDDPVIPDDWNVNWNNQSEKPIAAPIGNALIGLVPGVIDRETQAALEPADQDYRRALFPLGNGLMLIAPEFRLNPQQASRLEYDRLAATACEISWLAAYAAYFGNNFHVDPWLLFGEAWRRLEEGSPRIALRLTQRAITCARNSLQQGVLQSLSQGIRIASQLFSEAANAPEPSPSIPRELRRFLLQAKGWGQVMCEQPASAERYLREASNLLELDAPDERERLYLLNISALNRLKLGDLDGALAIEKNIETRSASLVSRDWHLEYVNMINIARLLRRQGDFAGAEHYYSRA